MTKKLIKTGHSEALILDKTMKEHLGLEGTVDVVLRDNEIVLRRPLTVREASKRSGEKYREAYNRLAK